MSNARTTVLALRAGADGKATNAYTDTVVTEAEMGIGPIEASFGTVDPPGPGDDELRARVMAMLGDTSDALATARIAVRRDDHAQMRVSADELSRLAAEMDTAQQALQ